MGIEEKSVTIFVNVFPNPTMDEISIELNLLKTENVKMNLINTSGQIMKSLELKQVRGAYKTSINLASYANGMYYLQIVTNEGVLNKKIFKQD